MVMIPSFNPTNNGKGNIRSNLTYSLKNSRDQRQWLKIPHGIYIYICTTMYLSLVNPANIVMFGKICTRFQHSTNCAMNKT